MNLGARVGVGLCACLLAVTSARAEDGASKPKVDASRVTLNQAFQKQDWDKVIELGPTVVAAAPNDGQAWHHLGYALHMKGQLDEALQAHLKAAEVGKGPIKALGFYNAACVYAIKKDNERAFEALAESIETAPLQAGQLEGDSDLDGLHGDARWKDLVAKAEARAGEVQLGAYSTQRMGSRILGFGARSIEVHLEWGPIAWKPEYEAMIESGKLDGQPWRMGADFWTTFDTNVPLTFGDKTLAPGMYYVTMTRNEGKVLLQFHDPAKVRDQRIDPFVVQTLLSRPVAVEMKFTKAEAVTKQLTMALTTSADAAAANNASLIVDFGPYHAVAAMNVPTK